jgi:hypothetical protein
MGILANFAFPAVSGLRRRAEAARIIADIHTVRSAALDHYAGYGSYPPGGQWGAVPPTLAASLPGGFTFGFRDVEYRWERWLLPGGLPADPSQTVLAGLTVRAPDAVLLAALRGLYKGHVTFGSSSEVTFVLD